MYAASGVTGLHQAISQSQSTCRLRMLMIWRWTFRQPDPAEDLYNSKKNYSRRMSEEAAPTPGITLVGMYASFAM